MSKIAYVQTLVTRYANCININNKILLINYENNAEKYYEYNVV